MIGSTNRGISPGVGISSRSGERSSLSLPRVGCGSRCSGSSTGDDEVFRVSHASELVRYVRRDVGGGVHSVSSTVVSRRRRNSTRADGGERVRRRRSVFLDGRLLGNCNRLSASLLVGCRGVVDGQCRRMGTANSNIVAESSLGFFSLSVFTTVRVYCLGGFHCGFSRVPCSSEGFSRGRFCSDLREDVDGINLSSLRGFMGFYGAVGLPTRESRGFGGISSHSVGCTVLCKALFGELSRVRAVHVLNGHLRGTMSDLTILFNGPSFRALAGRLRPLSRECSCMFHVGRIRGVVEDLD